MARLGIDFGTTNTVAVAHDRGMFSVVLHEADTGAGRIVQEVLPSAILLGPQPDQRFFGLEADRRFAQLGRTDGWTLIPSLKRQLRDYAEGRMAGDADVDVAALLEGFLDSLAASIRTSLDLDDAEPLEAVITWPANANGAQRHITRQCFRRAGFEVLATLNEPTASAIELADCVASGRRGRDRKAASAVAVFDLGGGTFDASVVWIEDDDFRVLTSSGIESLGGDDFDEVLLAMLLERLKLPGDAVGPLARHALLRQLRSQKEMIASGATQSLFLNPGDFGLSGAPTTIPVEGYFERLRPMLAPAVQTLGRVIDSAAAKEPRIGAAAPLTIYLVGGSSKLPLVAQMVGEAFETSRVVLTDKPFRSVAMGAAIAATDRVTVRDVFARHFGLIRLSDHGRREHFATIFPAGTAMPRRGEAPLEKVAWYHPMHTVGHLRYLECTTIGDDGLPAGDVRAWSDILFPYDPAEPLSACLPSGAIEPTDRFADQAVCEVYRCDADGVITVELRRPGARDARCYEIYQD